MNLCHNCNHTLEDHKYCSLSDSMVCSIFPCYCIYELEEEIEK